MSKLSEIESRIWKTLLVHYPRPEGAAFAAANAGEVAHCSMQVVVPTDARFSGRTVAIVRGNAGERWRVRDRIEHLRPGHPEPRQHGAPGHTRPARVLRRSDRTRPRRRERLRGRAPRWRNPRNARTRVLAVGFAVHQGHTVFRELAQRHDENESLKVTLCLDVRRPPSNTTIDSLLVEGFARNFLENEWPWKRPPEMFYDPRSLAASETTRSALHAKCIVVDGRKALVTSANFTEAAQERNIELGLLVNSTQIAEGIERHFRELIDRKVLDRLPIR